MSEAVVETTAGQDLDRPARRSSGAWSHIWTIAKREIGGYFQSPIAYVFIVIFLLLAGFFTFMVAGFFDRARPAIFVGFKKAGDGFSILSAQVTERTTMDPP